jgi:hypothetical protein
MNSSAFLPLSKSNSKIDRKQVAFGAKDFQERPPTLAPIFASLDQEMDLMIRSFNFHVGSLGSVRLSDLVNLGPSARQIAITAASETLVGSSSKVNSPVSIKPTKGSTVEELNKIMENLYLDESLGSEDIGSDENLEKSHSHSEEAFMAYYGNVSSNSEDAWRVGLKLYNDEHMFPSSVSSHYANNRHQVYVIINDANKEFDALNNPIINPQNLMQESQSGRRNRVSRCGKGESLTFSSRMSDDPDSSKPWLSNTSKLDKGSLNGVPVCPAPA